MNIRNRSCLVIFVASLIFGVSQHAAADSQHTVLIPTPEKAVEVNKHTIGVVFTHEELFHQLVHNMEDALEPESGLRIVPIMGKNHVQSIYDLLYLKGVDLAMVRADALEYVKRKGKFHNIGRLIHNVVKVSEEKIVVIANEKIKSVDDLKDKRVVFGTPGSGEYVTGNLTFDSLGIHTESQTISIAEGVKQLKSGTASAMVYLLKESDAIHSNADAKTRDLIQTLTKEDKLHALPLNEDARLSAIYNPATLTKSDLPNLFGEGEEIATYAVDAILAAYRWRADHPRIRKVSRFVDALAQNLKNLKEGGYQPVWERVDLKINTPNVQKSTLVQRILDEEERLAKKRRNAERAQLKEQKNAEVASLQDKRNRLIKLLSDKIANADSAEADKISNQLGELLSSLDDEGVDSESADEAAVLEPVDEGAVAEIADEGAVSEIADESVVSEPADEAEALEVKVIDKKTVDAPVVDDKAISEEPTSKAFTGEQEASETIVAQVKKEKVIKPEESAAQDGTANRVTDTDEGISARVVSAEDQDSLAQESAEHEHAGHVHAGQIHAG